MKEIKGSTIQCLFWNTELLIHWGLHLPGGWILPNHQSEIWSSIGTGSCPESTTCAPRIWHHNPWTSWTVVRWGRGDKLWIKHKIHRINMKWTVTYHYFPQKHRKLSSFMGLNWGKPGQNYTVVSTGANRNSKVKVTTAPSGYNVGVKEDALLYTWNITV